MHVWEKVFWSPFLYILLSKSNRCYPSKQCFLYLAHVMCFFYKFTEYQVFGAYLWKFFGFIFDVWLLVWNFCSPNKGKYVFLLQFEILL